MSLSPGSKDLSEILLDFLTIAARWVLGLGATAALVGVGFLVAILFRISGTSGLNPADVQHQIEIFQKLLYVGVLGVAVGSTYLFWGSEVLGAIQLLGAGALWFAPVYVPMILNNTSGGPGGDALGALQTGGSILGAVGIAVLVIDLSLRIRDRVKSGAKADTLRFGKGIKEDPDRQNVFLGKCWQLPFCRKFVRERCPIYHSKRTCWKEKVGCMCEEQVIRGAMENKVIPKDAILAAKMIPVNHRLTDSQKMERCRNCVIYNEHQKHKYKIALPGTVVGAIVLYALLRPFLLASTASLIKATNSVIYAGTLGGVQKVSTPEPFVEALLVVFFIVALSYSLKVLEYLIFKLKI